jgi:hypothetical protein
LRKRNKSPKGGGTKDSITGATWNLDGNEIRSDKAYTGLVLPLDSIFAGGSTSWDKTLEMEIGDPRFIVITSKYTYVSSNDPTSGFPSTHTEITTRQVWEGDFTYTKGRLVKAKLQRVSADDRSTTTWIDGQHPPITSSLGYVSKPANNSGGIDITDPSSLASWVPALSPLQAGGSGMMIPNIAEVYYGTPIPTGAENEAGVRAYQSGRFFTDGWWNNPFTPNLI